MLYHIKVDVFTFPSLNCTVFNIILYFSTILWSVFAYFLQIILQHYSFFLRYISDYNDDKTKDASESKPKQGNVQKIDKINCDYKTGPSSPGQGQMCKVESKAMQDGPCNKEYGFGFKTGTPCILLKLNRVS